MLDHLPRTFRDVACSIADAIWRVNDSMSFVDSLMPENSLCCLNKLSKVPRLAYSVIMHRGSESMILIVIGVYFWIREWLDVNLTGRSAAANELDDVWMEANGFHYLHVVQHALLFIICEVVWRKEYFLLNKSFYDNLKKNLRHCYPLFVAVKNWLIIQQKIIWNEISPDIKLS